MLSPFLTKAQQDYAGPHEMKIHADILPYIGEVVISFSWLERRVTWAIESLLQSTRDEADHMEAFVRSFTSRIEFLELTGNSVARETKTVEDFSKLVQDIRDTNSFRNYVIHNSFSGVSMAIDGNLQVSEVSAIKSRFHKTPDKRSYRLSTSELRANAEQNLKLCTDIHRWVLAVRPQAENRVP